MNQNSVRSDLKYRAKDAIRKNYWPAVLVSLILTIITYVCGNGNAGSGTRSVITQYRYQSGGSYYWGSVTDKIYGIGEYVLHNPLGILLAIVSTGLMLSLLAIGIACFCRKCAGSRELQILCGKSVLQSRCEEGSLRL